MDVVKNFRDVQGGKTTFVRFENVTNFLIVCGECAGREIKN